MQALRNSIFSLLETSLSKSPEAETELILFSVLKSGHPELRSLTDLKLATVTPSHEEESRALKLAESRASGIPLQHLLGSQFFYSHEYAVNASTLIPRPETEVLIDSAIQWVEQNFAENRFHFAELGLGSGIISTEILSRFKNSRGVASEASQDAITLAKENLKAIIGPDFNSRFQIISVAEFGTGFDAGFEVFSHLGPFDLILSNPPYLSQDDEIETEVAKHEPGTALFPLPGTHNPDPNFFYLSFLANFRVLLKPGGAVFFEVPHERAEDLLQAFRDAGLTHSSLIPDLTGRPRVLMAELK
jgi:release factor glutamine methyltransferase